MTHGEPEYDEPPPILWRHLRTAVTLLVLVGIMVAAAYFGWQRVVGDDADTDAAASDSCVPSTDVTIPAPDDVEINVYNATGRSGLAAEVADLMRERGFVIAQVANDPENKDIEGTAEIRGSQSQQGAAALLTTTVPESVFVPDEREADTLDVVVGEGFTELAPPDTPVPEPTAEADECTPPPDTAEPTEAPATDDT